MTRVDSELLINIGRRNTWSGTTIIIKNRLLLVLQLSLKEIGHEIVQIIINFTNKSIIIAFIWFSLVEGLLKGC